MAREQGIEAPQMPDPRDCDSSFTQFASGVAISAVAGASIGALGGPKAAAVGAITSGITAGIRDTWDDHIKSQQCTKEQYEKYEQESLAYEQKLRTLNPNYGKPITYWLDHHSRKKAEEMQRQNTHIAPNLASSSVQPTIGFSTTGKTHRIQFGARY